jgi:hypothetical protein
LNPGNPDTPLNSDKTQLETAETTKNSPISATPVLTIKPSQQTPTQKSKNPQLRLSHAVGQV